MTILLPLMFLAGFVDSIAGGGGLISLTSFFAFGVPAHVALGTNKLAAVLGTGLSAGYFIRKGHAQWRSALYAAVGALAGAPVGARIALLIDERILTYLVLACLPPVAAFLLFKRDLGVTVKTLSPAWLFVSSLSIGLLIGMYDGFFGPGTGTFLIIAFTTVVGLDLLSACCNTKIVNFASNIAAVLTFARSGDIDYRLGIPCAACVILGHLVGARLAVRNGIKIVRPLMLTVIALLVVKILFDLAG